MREFFNQKMYIGRDLTYDYLITMCLTWFFRVYFVYELRVFSLWCWPCFVHELRLFIAMLSSLGFFALILNWTNNTCTILSGKQTRSKYHITKLKSIDKIRRETQKRIKMTSTLVKRHTICFKFQVLSSIKSQNINFNIN